MRTILFENGIVKLIDQRRLPQIESYMECRSWKDVEKAIRKMAIRGAPALGAAGAYAMTLEASKATSKKELFSSMKKSSKIKNARPTAKNLSWAVERMEEVVKKNQGMPLKELKRIIIKESDMMAEEDIKTNRKISTNGARLLKKKSRILTHCNAGGLACVEVGTALGVMEEASRQGKVEMVYATETRPLLQGMRLTIYELTKKKIPVTLIVDSACGFLMQQKKVNCVMVGADRIARNGDTANKIGTYTIAALAYSHKIPFYVAAPSSTFDLSVKTGKEIIVEERDCREILSVGKKRIVPDVSCWNPAFDITPAKYIRAFITEKGVMTPRETAKSI